MSVVGRLRFVPAPFRHTNGARNGRVAAAVSQPGADPVAGPMTDGTCAGGCEAYHAGSITTAATARIGMPRIRINRVRRGHDQTGDMPMYRLRQAPVPVLAASLAILLAGPGSAATPSTERVQRVHRRGYRRTPFSNGPSISADGRFVAFVSLASTFVPGDTNGRGDLFVRDRRNGTTERVSVSSTGVQQDDGWPYFEPSISADGRFVAFASDASNLVAGDTNGPYEYDVFLRDRRNGTTTLVNVSSTGVGERCVLLTVDLRQRPLRGLRVHRRQPGARRHERRSDVFVRDRRSGTTERVSVSSAGEAGERGSGPAVDLRRRPLRRVLQRCHEPRGGRHERRRMTSSCATAGTARRSA